MAIYNDLKQVSDDIYETTVIPTSFIDKLKLAYIIIFQSEKIRCRMNVSKLWFDTMLQTMILIK